MIIHTVEQGTPEWFELRRGIPTASEFKKLYTSQGKPSTSAKTYIYELVAEILAGQELENYTNEWMERGKELEQEARDLYTLITDNPVEQVGFITADNAGCSPDGLVGDKGMVEIKCPKASTHVKYLLDNRCPAEYYPQVQGQLWIAGREWCDFVSYYPGIKSLIVRVERDEKYIQGLSEAVADAAKQVLEIKEAINER